MRIVFDSVRAGVIVAVLSVFVGAFAGQDPVNVRSVGAKGDGVADDTDAIQAALNAGTSQVLFPDGTYLMGTITVPGDTTILFAPRAVVRINIARVKDKTLLVLGGDRVAIDGPTFDFTGPDGNQVVVRDKLLSLISGNGVGWPRITRLHSVRPHDGERPVGEHKGWNHDDFSAIALKDCHDVEVYRCYAVNAKALVETLRCRNVSVHESRAEWCEYLTSSCNDQGVRHHSNWSRDVVFQCVWWGGDPNDMHDWVPNNTSNVAHRDRKPGDEGYHDETVGVYDISVQNNYAEYGVTLAWGAKARNVIMNGNIARYMTDMAYDSEGDERVIISNNIAINSQVSGIGCYFWTDKVLITGNTVLVLEQGEDRYKGSLFVRLHSGGQRGPDHFGTGKALITGNLFVSEAKGLRTIQVESCRDVTISGNKLINGRIDTQPWDTSHRVAILGNDFDWTVPKHCSAVRLVARGSEATIRNNVFRRSVEAASAPLDGAAVYISTAHDRLFTIEGNQIIGWAHAVSCQSSANPAGPARFIVRNNTVRGDIHLIGARAAYRAVVADNIHAETLEVVSAKAADAPEAQ